MLPKTTFAVEEGQNANTVNKKPGKNTNDEDDESGSGDGRGQGGKCI